MTQLKGVWASKEEGTKLAQVEPIDYPCIRDALNGLETDYVVIVMNGFLFDRIIHENFPNLSAWKIVSQDVISYLNSKYKEY